MTPYWKRDRKSRWLFAIANLSLAVGLMLRVLVQPASGLARNWMDGLCGLLLGISIGMNVMLVIKARRCRTESLERL